MNEKILQHLSPEIAALILNEINALANKERISPELSEVRSAIIDFYKTQDAQYKKVFEEVMK